MISVDSADDAIRRTRAILDDQSNAPFKPDRSLDARREAPCMPGETQCRRYGAAVRKFVEHHGLEAGPASARGRSAPLRRRAWSGNRRRLLPARARDPRAGRGPSPGPPGYAPWSPGPPFRRRQTSKPSMPGIITSSRTMSQQAATAERPAPRRPLAGGPDLEILGRQPCLEQLDVGEDVVDDQDARGHAQRSLSPDSNVVADRFQKLDDGNRLGQVRFAAALPDFFLVALHGESGDRYHGDGSADSSSSFNHWVT